MRGVYPLSHVQEAGMQAVQSSPPAPARARVLHALARLCAEPRLSLLLLNAQAQLRGRTRAPLPLTVRLTGSVRTRGGGEIRLGAGVTIDGTITPVEFVATRPGRIDIGAGSFINYGVSISAHQSVVIGAGCHIGHYCFIYDNDLHTIDALSRLPPSQPVVLEDRVWLGTRAIVLKGVRIGHDAVIGAGSVVTHDIPAGAVAAGVPARLLRRAPVAEPPAAP